MSNFFIYIYNLLHERKWLFYLLVSASILFILLGVSKIRFVENISGISGNQAKVSKSDYIINHFRFSEKLVINLCFADTSAVHSEDDLCVAADSIAIAIEAGCKPYFSRLFYKANDSIFPELQSDVNEYLPLFLNDQDYSLIDSLTTVRSIDKSIGLAYHQLISPASIALKKQILKDPLGICGMALRKLQSLQGNEQFETYNGYILSRDHRHLLMFITPSNPPEETGRNVDFIYRLDHILKQRTGKDKALKAEYFGAVAVAVGNAKQLKKDIFLTIGLALLAIFLLLGLYFRSFWVPLLSLLPAFFGGGLAVSILAFIKGSVSAIALGIGSVILGLIIDYSLYLINQYRRNGDMIRVLQEMSQSIVICALTSVGAFLCLVFLDSSVLHDLGWFAAISITGAAFFALVFLPQVFFGSLTNIRPGILNSFIDKIGKIRFEDKPAMIIILGILTVTSLFFFKKAGFETDMNTLNFVDPSLHKAGDDLEKLSAGKYKNIYIVATGKDREEALRANERIQNHLTVMMDKGIIGDVSGIRTLMFSDSLSNARLSKWNSFFTVERSREIIARVNRSASAYGFKPLAFEEFRHLLEKSYRPMEPEKKAGFESGLFSEWLMDRPGLSTVTSIARVKPVNQETVYRHFSSLCDVVVFDRQKLTERFVERVRSDFGRLVMLSMIFVSLLLWISFGRIELAVITAIPMYLSWLITLGFMGASGIRFNIFNIIVSSFIFGLGVDYSILMMRGIMQDYKYRTSRLFSYKVAVILSSATTLFGVAALFTAKHPALNSIALISVFGISILVLISFTIQPLVAGWFLTGRLRKNAFPITARIFIKTFITWGNIVLIAIILALCGSFMFFLLPVKRAWKEDIFHKMFCGLSRLYIFLVFPNRKFYNPCNEDFSKPAVIISNHQSLIETPAMLRLSPKIIILTNTWVYNSPVFGPIARLASFYNVDNGLDNIINQLREKVSQGYSVLIFPEAHRSTGNEIKRFHKGAFYLAEQLKLDILPLMMFGSGDFLERGAFWGRPNKFRQKVYPRIAIDNVSFGASYQERTKEIRKFYIRKYAQFLAQEGTPAYYRRKLMLGYVYKGPVLEWYIKVKLRLENNYTLLHQWVPRQGEILDLGCGYGFVAYMLALSATDRMITGVDYDRDKIEVANGSFLKTSGINFETADIRTYNFTNKDCIILSDVLHYLPTPDQEPLLAKCMENLKAKGIIIIREADESREKGHLQSRLTEFLSTSINFNKTYDGKKMLHFISGRIIEKIAAQEGFMIEVIGSKKYSSNTYYILKRKNEVSDEPGSQPSQLPGQTGENPAGMVENTGNE